MKKKSKKAALSKEFENFLADIDSLVRATSDVTGDELNEVRAKIHARVEEAKESVIEASDDLTRRARKSAKRVNRGVHNEPWKAIGIGAAVGLLLGMVFARR